MLNINKELLIARLSYLNEIHQKPGLEPIDPKISEKIEQMIETGAIKSYMVLESVYTYLKEKLKEDHTLVDQYANEIISFID